MADAPALAANRRICLVPRVHGIGGMVTFSHKLAAGLAQRGVQVCYDLRDEPYQAVLVIGGTRQLGGLWQARRRGALIVQRLDGMNWLHRLRSSQGRRTADLRHYLRSEYGNFILFAIRSRLAQRVIYQSEFSRTWWERVHGSTCIPTIVVHNGVDLHEYTPHGIQERPQDCYRILMVEGSLMGGYESGLETGIRLVELLGHADLDKPVELMIVGRVPSRLQNAWDHKTSARLKWAGQVEPGQIPQIDRSAHLLFSSDLNAACPNSVIEALACGLPVISFATGALPELATPETGRVVPYGGDPWKLDPPDIPALAQAAAEVLHDQEAFRSGARRRADEAFGLEKMVDRYLHVLLES
jgi:glycosyltransferase involved in cell wall biosynthesis